jgi:DNA-binding Lrp family transcriptional regulator
MVEGEAYVDSPYLISRHELWGRKIHTFFSIVVPSTAVNQAQKIFEKSFPKTWIWIVNRFENYLSFSSYNTDTGDWNIDWTSWSLYLSEVLSQGWNKVIPEKRTETDSSESSEKNITTIDLQFVAKLLEKFDISTSDLSEEFRYSVPHASRIKESLISRGILQPSLNIDHIGLNENILFLVESEPNTLNAFVYAVKELPKTWIYWMKSLEGSSYLACWLELPLGSITPFERAVRETLRPLAEYQIFFRSKHEGSRVSFLELLDTETKTWKWSPEMLKIKS